MKREMKRERRSPFIDYRVLAPCLLCAHNVHLNGRYEETFHTAGVDNLES